MTKYTQATLFGIPLVSDPNCLSGTHFVSSDMLSLMKHIGMVYRRYDKQTMTWWWQVKKNRIRRA